MGGTASYEKFSVLILPGTKETAAGRVMPLDRLLTVRVRFLPITASKGGTAI